MADGFDDIDVVRTEQVDAAGAGVADGGDDPERELVLDVEIPLLPMARAKGGFGKVGLAMETRGVAGGLVTVTMRFC